MAGGLMPLLTVPGRVNASHALKVTGGTGGSTGATKDTVDAADYFLRPLAQDRTPGFPAFYLYLSDIPTASPCGSTGGFTPRTLRTT